MKSHPTYETLEEIGRGSLATVYRARDLALKRYVAIKELHDKFQGNVHQMEQFWEEAQFLANVKHDNIVQIHGLDKERGWIIMELLKGSLDANLAEGPLLADLVRSVLRQVLSGLQELHRMRKFHGAVKPANLLISDKGRVKLSDSAGISLAEEIRRPKGSAKYLAPELLNPEFGEVGTQVDLYCLGLTALELLRGPTFDKLFKGVGPGAGDRELAWMRWHGSAADVLPPLRELMPSLPADLAHVIDKLLKKHVTERYATAAEALKDLENRPLVLVEPVQGVPVVRAAAGTAVTPLVAPPAPPVPKAKPPAPLRRRSVVKTLLAGLITLAAVVLGAAMVLPGSDPGVKVALQTNPALASVWLNGEWLNDKDAPRGTPAEIMLKAGTNKLLVKAAGYKNKPLEVTVRDEAVEIKDTETNATRTLKAGKEPLKVLLTALKDGDPRAAADLKNLQPPIDKGIKIEEAPNVKSPTLLLVNLLPGAKVFVNGKEIAVTDGKILVPAEKFTLKVEKKGFFTFQKENITPPTEKDAKFDVKLVRAVQVTVVTDPPGAAVTLDGKPLKPPATLELPPGKYEFRAALDGYLPATQKIELTEADETREVKLQLPLRRPQQFALLAGVRNPTRDLPEFVHAGADVEELGRVLRAGGFDPARLSVLSSGKPATAKQLRAELQRLAKEPTVADTALVALVGHAVRLGGDKTVYYCPADANLMDRDSLLPLDEVFAALQQSKARNKLVLLDLWRADVGSEKTALPATVLWATPGDIIEVPGVTIVAAGSGKEAGYEYLGPFQRHGVFMQFVIRGLLGAADRDNDQKVTLGELTDYLSSEMPRYTQTTFKQAQTPRLLDGAKDSIKDLVLVQRKGVLENVYAGLVALEAGQPKKALPALNEAAKAGDYFVEVFTLRAAAQYLLGEAGDRAAYDRAQEDCLRALKLDPSNAKAHGHLGEIHVRLAELASGPEARDANYKKAFDYHAREIELEPGCSLGYDNRGLAYESQSFALNKAAALQSAVEDYTAAIAKNRFRGDHFIHRGMALKYQKEYGRAIPDFDRAIELEPRNSTLYYHRAWLKRATGQSDKAIVDLDQAIALQKGAYAYWNLRGVCHGDVQKFDQAIDDYNEAFRLLSTFVKVANGKVEGDKALAADAAQVLVNRGIAYHEKAKRADNDRKLLLRAVEDYDAAERFNPSSYNVFFNRSDAHHRLGNLDQARKDRERADQLK
jgi:serine/threonine-protein kinase